MVCNLLRFDNTRTLFAIWYCFKYKASLKVAFITLIFKETAAGYEGDRQSSKLCKLESREIAMEINNPAMYSSQVF